MAECPSENVLLDFAGGRLSASATGALLDHLDSCAACQVALDAAVQEDASTATGSRPVSPPGPGAALASGARFGRYTILQRIGEGGMGVVYAAYDPELARRVALKLLRPGDGLSSGEARARLTREARAMARLTHPNVVSVHDAGTHGADVFVAMELVEGANLRHWLQERRPDWKEALRILIAAGQGLAAAHRAGLVHRDVKPDNILVGADGQVRVTDFGLARSSAEPAPAQGTLSMGEAGQPALPDEPTITRQGTLVGTPAYLAPEQLRSQPASPLTDQFSFCVTAFEALHGVRPFDRDARERMIAGQPVSPRDPPSSSQLPARVCFVVRRGLEQDPARRYPSMDALLDDLAGRKARTRRRMVAIGLSLAAMGLAGHAASAAAARFNICRRVSAELAGTWGEPQRQALQAAFAGSGAPYAARTSEVVERSLDRYAAAWTELRVSACEASFRDSASELPLLQRVCLERRRTELRSLVEVLAAADDKVVARSVEAVSALMPIAHCADAAALGVPVVPPKDADTRAKVDALREKLAKVKALHDAGRYQAALPAAQAAVAEARALEYLPVLAEALVRQGKVQLVTGATKDAISGYEEAELAADESHDHHAAAAAAVDLIQAYSVLQRLPEAQRWRRRAEAYLRRLGRDDDLKVELFYSSGNLAREEGRLVEAAELFGRAAAARERQFGPDHPTVARALFGQAVVLESLGELHQAMELADRVMEIQRKTLGLEHPQVLRAGYLRGQLLVDMERSAEAVAVLRPVLEAQIAQLGADSPMVESTALALALALGKTGEHAEAHRSFEIARAAATREKGAASFRMAQILGFEADLLRDEKRHREALAMSQQVLELFTQLELPEHDDRWVLPLTVQADTLRELKRFPEALERYQRAVGIREKALGRDSQFFLVSLLSLGETHLELGDVKRAAPLLEEYVQRADMGRVPSVERKARGRFLLARALWANGADRARARALAEESKQDLAGAAGCEALRAEVARWLDARK